MAVVKVNSRGQVVGLHCYCGRTSEECAGQVCLDCGHHVLWSDGLGYYVCKCGSAQVEYKKATEGSWAEYSFLVLNGERVL